MDHRREKRRGLGVVYCMLSFATLLPRAFCDGVGYLRVEAC